MKFIKITTLSQFSPLPTLYRVQYYWYSLAFTLLRSFAVAFSASSINEESKEVIKTLNAVPSSSWNEETSRFLNEIQGENIALTGTKLFFVTRQLILGVSYIQNGNLSTAK